MGSTNGYRYGYSNWDLIRNEIDASEKIDSDLASGKLKEKKNLMPRTPCCEKRSWQQSRSLILINIDLTN